MKPFLIDCFSPVLPDVDCAPPAEAISSLARELWARYGFPSNHDKSIWQEAERQLLALQHQTHCCIGLAIHG